MEDVPVGGGGIGIGTSTSTGIVRGAVMRRSGGIEFRVEGCGGEGETECCGRNEQHGGMVNWGTYSRMEGKVHET
jgi:hypothetical protein